MFIYLTLKMTMKTILDECNRIAEEEEALERRRLLRSSLLRVQQQYENGEIDFETYNTGQNEILHAMTGI